MKRGNPRPPSGSGALLCEGVRHAPASDKQRARFRRGLSGGCSGHSVSVSFSRERDFPRQTRGGEKGLELAGKRYKWPALCEPTVPELEGASERGKGSPRAVRPRLGPGPGGVPGGRPAGERSVWSAASHTSSVTRQLRNATPSAAGEGAEARSTGRWEGAGEEGAGLFVESTVGSPEVTTRDLYREACCGEGVAPSGAPLARFTGKRKTV